MEITQKTEYTVKVSSAEFYTLMESLKVTKFNVTEDCPLHVEVTALYSKFKDTWENK